MAALEMLVDVFTSTSRAKSRDSALLQGFAITRDEGKWPLTSSFLTQVLQLNVGPPHVS